jgi:signal transduction histidine kinase
MLTSPSWLRYPYRSSIPPVVQPWIQPGRHALLNYRHRWPPIRRIVVVAMLLLAANPLLAKREAIPQVIFCIAAYLVWQVGFDWAEQNPRLSGTTQQHAINGVRYLGGLGGLTLLIMLAPTLATELWMLYLIPLPTLGVSLGRKWVFSLISLTVILLVLSPLSFYLVAPGAADFWQLLRVGLFRGILGSYVAFTSYLLVRSLAYQHRVNRNAVERLQEVTASSNWREASNSIASIIADLFSEDRHPVTANVLTYDPATNQMRIVGSSTEDGRKLARERFRFPAEKGITSWAVHHGEACFINDTARDPEGRFLPNAAFPDSRSALAVPMKLAEDQWAVLEVESTQPADFAQEDLQLLQLVASHLIASHRRTELLEVHQDLAELGQELASDIIQDESVGSLLERVGRKTQNLLNADIIGFYYRDADTGEIRGRYAVGSLRVPDIEGSPVNDPDDLVYQLMQTRKPVFFDAVQCEERLTRWRAWHDQHGLEPFVVRERVVSAAAIPLVAGSECIGLMWVNYRRKVEFDPLRRNLIQLIAPYAALAIQSGLQAALAERKRREQVRRTVHDSLSHRLHDIGRGVEKLRCQLPGSIPWKEEWVIVQSQVERAQRVVENLMGECHWYTLQSVVEDLCALARQIERTYEIPVEICRDPVPSTPVSIQGGNELIFACDEVLGNITRHAEAKHISITIGMVADDLIIAVEDDGIGFDPRQVRCRHGLDNIRARIENLSGEVSICSAPGVGTAVYMSIPIPTVANQEDNHGGRGEARAVDRE